MTVSKDKVFEIFKIFKQEVENQSGKKIKKIRTDGGGEYIVQKNSKYIVNNLVSSKSTSPSGDTESEDENDNEIMTIPSTSISQLNNTSKSISLAKKKRIHQEPSRRSPRLQAQKSGGQANVSINENNTPLSYKESIKLNDSDKWSRAIKEQLDVSSLGMFLDSKQDWWQKDSPKLKDLTITKPSVL